MALDRIFYARHDHVAMLPTERKLEIAEQLYKSSVHDGFFYVVDRAQHPSRSAITFFVYLELLRYL